MYQKTCAKLCGHGYYHMIKKKELDQTKSYTICGSSYMLKKNLVGSWGFLFYF